MLNLRIVIKTKKGSTKIEHFMTLGAGGLVLGRGHINHEVKMNDFFKYLLLPGAGILVLRSGHISHI